MSTFLSILAAWASEELCPEGTFAHGDACVRNVTQLEFEGLEVGGTPMRPSLQFVSEHVAPRYPCDELRGPGRVEAWDSCMRNYYGATDVTALSESVSTRFAESRACPTDTADIASLEQIAEHYAKHPRAEDLTPLEAYPLDVTSGATEPHLPTMCGYSVEQARWYEPRNFYCDGTDCFAQGKRGPKDLVRYSPLAAIPNLMKMVTVDRGIGSIGSGGGYGHLRLIPLGNDVFLATAGGMYGNVFFYGLVIVPQEEHYLRRACEGERLAETERVPGVRRRLLGQSAQRTAEAEALVELRRISAVLAERAGAVEAIERVQLMRTATALTDVLNGNRAARGPTEPGCVRYHARYPRGYEQTFAGSTLAAR